MTFEKLYKILVEADAQPPVQASVAPEPTAPAPPVQAPVTARLQTPTPPPEPVATPEQLSEQSALAMVLLGKSFQLLKNDEVFVDQLKGIMNGFKKNRNQKTEYQERVIKTKPKTIEGFWNQINRLIKIVNDPKKRDDKSHAKFMEELEKIKGFKDDAQKELDDVYHEIEALITKNEELDEQFSDQLHAVVHHTAKRLYDRQSKDVPEGSEDLDMAGAIAGISKNPVAQCQTLESLTVEDATTNPLIMFLTSEGEKYEEAKQRYFEVKNGVNYAVAIEQMYQNLPLFSFINYFSEIILKGNTIKLIVTSEKSKHPEKTETTKEKKSNPMLDKLSTIRTEAQFDEFRPELIAYLQNINTGVSHKNMLLGMAKGPFITRKGSANAATKISSSLRASNIKESFDDLTSKLLKSYRYDEDNFKINLMEVLQK